MTADHPLARAKTAACRWCTDHTRIVWCITFAGKRIPIEVAPNPGGNVSIQVPNNGAPPFAIVHSGPPGMLDDWLAYMPHHATCPRDLTEENTR